MCHSPECEYAVHRPLLLVPAPLLFLLVSLMSDGDAVVGGVLAGPGSGHLGPLFANCLAAWRAARGKQVSWLPPLYFGVAAPKCTEENERVLL